MTMAEQQHYEEDVLAAFVDVPHELLANDEHLATCAACAETLGTMRATASLLNCREIWDETPLPARPPAQHIEKLRTLAANMKDEDAIAETRVKQLLAKSSDTWASTLREHPEWHTAGLVRRLIAANAALTYNSPADAFILTKMCSEIAAQTASDKPLSVFEAYFEYAYACLYIGSHAAALVAVDHAGDCLNDGVIAAMERARLDLLRSMILQEIEYFDDAARLAADAGRVFRRYGDVNRYAMAKLTEAAVLFRSSQYRQAVPIYVEIDALTDVLDPQTVAFAYVNGAICSRETGDFARAEDKFVNAVRLFTALGLSTPLVKSNWLLARLFVATGQYERALVLFQTLRTSFKELGMSYDLAGVLVDASETLLALGRSDEIAPLCREAIAYFEKSGLTYTTGARTALAYLGNASAADDFSFRNIQLVRAYFEQLPRSPQLLFADPRE